LKRMKEVHVRGTENVMEVAMQEGLGRVVYTSSTAAIGFSWKLEPQDEKSPWIKRHNHVGYMYTKRLGEEAALSFVEKGLEVVSVNPTSFFGAGDINMNEGELFRNIQRRRLKKSFPGGMGVVSVKDTVEGHFLAMERGVSGERYILSDKNLTLSELFNIIAEELDVQKIEGVWPKISLALFYPTAYCIEKAADLIGKKTKLTPQAVALGFGYRWYDSTKARQELGWKPEQEFKESVREAAEFYKAQGLL